MPIEISNYPCVVTKCEALGVDSIEGIVILPNNFEAIDSLEDSVHFISATTVSKLLKQSKLHTILVEPKGDHKRLVQKSDIWFGPTLFFAAAELSQNPHMVTVSLGVISNYLTNLFKGAPREEIEISLNIVTEQTKTKKTRKFEYRGGIEGLKVLDDAIKEEIKNAKEN